MVGSPRSIPAVWIDFEVLNQQSNLGSHSYMEGKKLTQVQLGMPDHLSMYKYLVQTSVYLLGLSVRTVRLARARGSPPASSVCHSHQHASSMQAVSAKPSR